MLYLFVAIHTVQLGTDMEIAWVRMLFFALNLILFVVIVVNIYFRLKNFIQRKKAKKDPAK